MKKPHCIIRRIGRNHLTTEVGIPALTLHLPQDIIREIFFCDAKTGKKSRQIRHHLTVGLCRAVIYHNLTGEIHTVFFQVGEGVHSYRNPLGKRYFFQSSGINRAVQHGGKFFDFGERNHADFPLNTVCHIVRELVVSVKQAFRIDPCNMFIPVIHKGYDICGIRPSRGRPPQCPAYHLGHQDSGDGRTGQKNGTGFR